VINVTGLCQIDKMRQTHQEFEKSRSKREEAAPNPADFLGEIPLDYRDAQHYVVARDRRKFYTGGMATTDVADGASFEELGRGYARDSRQVYFLGRVVEGADPVSFSTDPVRGVKAPRKDAPVVRDKTFFYQAGNKIAPR
jgi:hypothetical protein